MDELETIATEIALLEERLTRLRQERNDIMATLHDRGDASTYALAKAAALSWEGVAKILAAYGPAPTEQAVERH